MIIELRTLIAVARYGTFSAAGERIGLTQAAVSGHMRRLEENLGFALFDRTGRSAILNAAGLRTLARAEALVAGFDALGEPTQDEEWAKPLEIGAIASVHATILTRALVPFRLRFANCRVNLSPGVSLQLMDRVEAGELDLAILIRPAFEPPRELEWAPLACENYVLLAARERNGKQPQVRSGSRGKEEMKQQHQQQRARLLPFHRQQPVEVEPQQMGPLPHGQ